MSETDPVTDAPLAGPTQDIEAPDADAAEQAAELDDRDAGPPEPVVSYTEANEADLAEQASEVPYDDDEQ